MFVGPKSEENHLYHVACLTLKKSVEKSGRYGGDRATSVPYCLTRVDSHRGSTRPAEIRSKPVGGCTGKLFQWHIGTVADLQAETEHARHRHCGAVWSGRY